jgi:hypothetical protein
MGPLYTPRPWLFSILFFILELDVLLAVRRTQQFRPLLLLPPLFAIWANVHIQFIYGLAALCIAAIEPSASRMLRGWAAGADTNVRSKPFWQIFVACGLATLFNPYGWRIYQVVVEYSQQKAVSYIQEFQPISFQSLPGVCLLLLAFGAVWAVASKGRRDLFSILLLAMASGLSFRFARDMWVVAVAGAAIIADSNRAPDRPFQPTARQWALVAAIVCAFVAVTATAAHVSNSTLENTVAREFPVAAAAEVTATAYPGPLYNDFNWGGYLIWSLPLRPVSIDGRTNLHGDRRIEQSVRTWNAQQQWADDPELQQARLIIGPVDAPLCAVLRLHPRYRLVYEDKVASVFVKREAASLAN